MATTIRDVAKLAGVSVATVSYVLNETKNVREETRLAVVQAVKDLRYIPNTVARSLRMHQSNTVALVIPDISNPYYTLIARAIEQELKSKDYYLLLCNTLDDHELEKSQLQQLRAQYPAGYIVVPVNRFFDYRSILPKASCPLVMVDRKTEVLQADTVLGDDSLVIKMVVEHLVRRGYQKVAYIAGTPNVSTTHERLTSFLSEMKKHGITVNPSLIKSGDYSFGSGYRLMGELIREADMNAVFVSNNTMTLGALNYLIEHSISVPEHVALVGYDCNYAAVTNPPLTAISEDLATMGKNIAEIMIELIDGGDQSYRPYREHRFPAKLTIRQST